MRYLRACKTGNIHTPCVKSHGLQIPTKWAFGALLLSLAGKSLRLRYGLLALLMLFFAQALSAEVLKVGVIAPLSGGFAEYGNAVRNGIELAIKEKPQDFKQIQFLYEDDAYEPKRAIAALNKFVDIDNIDMLFLWGNESALGVAPVSERRKLPSIFAAQHPGCSAGFKYNIRFVNSANDYGKAMADYLAEQKKNKIFLIKTEISFYNILLDSLKNNLHPQQQLKVFETFIPVDMDFRTVITRLKKESFDTLGVYLTIPQLLQFFKQAAELDFHPQVFGSTPFESKTVVEQGLGLMEGAVFAHITASDDFKTRYLEAYGQDIEVSYAANAYEFAKMVARLFGQQANKPSADEILSAFANISPGTGASGKYTFSSSPENGKYIAFDVAVKKIQNGKIVTVTKAE